MPQVFPPNCSIPSVVSPSKRPAEAGKPEAMLEKIAEGTVQKYLKEVTLLGQVFVKAEDGKQTIEQLLKAKGASVAGFTLYMVGEGIEKKVERLRCRSCCPGCCCRCQEVRKETDDHTQVQAHSPEALRRGPDGR
jgi:hypothetical protein